MEKYIEELNTTEGFIALFYRLTTDYPNYPMAYEAAERIHERYFSEKKYASYNSFRQILYRKIKKSKP